MTIRNLSALLHAGSIALVGGSARPGTVGAVVLDNILFSGFAGSIHVVNPHRVDHGGIAWVPTITDLPFPPDLAIIMTPAEAVPGVITDLGAIGNRCAVVISAGLTEANGLRQKMLDAARPHLMRVVGPNCLGIAAPHIALDATFARNYAKAGRLALISQSGALITAILDWAQSRGVGFSGVVSAGDMADVDLGDLVDLFALDSHTDAILLYIEGVTDAAKFMSAARAAARVKPVIAIKAGRSPSAAVAAFSHTGALSGSYDVYRAALERAGVVVVDTLTELFDAAEIICTAHEPRGDRLGIVTNGGGAGILAIDGLAAANAKLAALTPATMLALDKHLPTGWSKGNPVDIIGDAGPDRYCTAVREVLEDPNVSALLVMNCPTGKARAVDIAAAVADQVKLSRAAGFKKPVIACWLGDSNAAAVRDVMSRARIPLYATPDDAVRGFAYLLAAQKARLALTDGPAATREPEIDLARAKQIVAAVRGDRRCVMTETESKALLDAFHIPTAPTRFAAAVESIEEECGWLRPPFAVKIISRDLTHKSDVGGVALGLHDRKAAAAAACAMEMRIGREHPEVHLEGFAVEEMIVRPHAHELLVGIATDPTFGPLLMIAAGGTSAEVIGDKAIDLVPLDDAQAHALIARTRIAKLLAGYRGAPAADIDAVASVLGALSAMCIALPDVVELDINPLLVDATGAVALDARVRITAEPATEAHLVILPPPMRWSADLVTKQGSRIFVRPVRADDVTLLGEFFAHVSHDDLRYRFMSGINEVSKDQLSAMARVDYRRTITFLAFDETRSTLLATAMLAADPDRTRAEVALATRADMKRHGISWTLLEHVLRFAKEEGIGAVEAVECADHDDALRMEREMGFVAVPDAGDATVRVVRRVLVPEHLG